MKRTHTIRQLEADRDSLKTEFEAMKGRTTYKPLKIAR
jgi:hypothetical protein